MNAPWKHNSVFPLFLLPVLAAVATGCGADDSAPSTEDDLTSRSVKAWFDAHAEDISSLEADNTTIERALDGAIDDDVTIVGVAESSHGTHEYNDLRTRMFQYLVEVHGFRAIVPESGLIEARLVEQYVLGADLDLDEVMTNGWTHFMGLDQEARELVEWMRAYNQGKEPSEQVHFAGKDLSILGDTLTVPLEPLAEYLAEVDPDFATSDAYLETMALARTACAVTLAVDEAYKKQGAHGIEPDLLDAFTTISFEQLTQEEQDRLVDGVRALDEHMRGQAEEYTAASSVDDYQWNAQLAVVATQVMRDLLSRQEHPKIFQYEQAVELLAAAAPEVKVDTRPASDPESHFMDYTSEADLHDYFIGRDTRELALAENVGWVVERYGKVMNFAHYSHIMKLPLEAAVAFGVTVKDPGTCEGAFLARDFGPQYVLFSGTNMSFTDKEGKPAEQFQGAPVVPVSDVPKSLEYEIQPVAKKHPFAFFVDFAHGGLDEAPRVRDRLGTRPMRFQPGFQETDVLANIDGLFVFQTVGPAIATGSDH